jgi:hypothetical protein
MGRTCRMFVAGARRKPDGPPTKDLAVAARFVVAAGNKAERVERRKAKERGNWPLGKPESRRGEEEGGLSRGCWGGGGGRGSAGCGFGKMDCCGGVARARLLPLPRYLRPIQIKLLVHSIQP